MAWLSVPSIPAKDQLSERTNDGRPPENASLDCVFTSTAAAVQGLTGIFTSGDQLKDIAKGEGYLGGGNEAWLVPLLARAPWHLRVSVRSEEHTSELQSHSDLVCRLLLEKKK